MNKSLINLSNKNVSDLLNMNITKIKKKKESYEGI